MISLYLQTFLSLSTLKSTKSDTTQHIRTLMSKAFKTVLSDKSEQTEYCFFG